MIPARTHWFLAALLIAAFALQAAMAWRLKAPTFDEPTHLAAGWSYLTAGDYRLNFEHPPLLKQWAALPMLPMALAEPSAYHGWEQSHQGTFAHYLFYEGADFDAMFWRARLMMIGLACLLGLWIYLWSRELWGPEGGLLSLFLFAFSPNLLAHSGIVGTDYGMAAFGLLSLWTWSRMLRRPTLARTLMAALASALVLLSKYSALVLIPVWAGFWILALASKGRWPASAGIHDKGLEAGDEGEDASGLFQRAYGHSADRGRAAKTLAFWAGRFALIGAVGALLIALDYGFQFGALFDGLGSFFTHAGQGHHTFFRGDSSHTGWWSYFPVTYLIKTPLAELGLLVWVSVGWVRRRSGWAPWALLAGPWLYMLVVASLGRVFIGYRHILLMVPLGLVMAGSVAANWGGRSVGPRAVSNSGGGRMRHRLAAVLLGLLCFWQVFAAARIFPHHLTYFNELIGGPRNGWKWLSDSNLDWGQDLSTLGRWMEREQVDWVYLAYFGTAEAELYGVKYRRLPGYNTLTEELAPMDPENPPPGIYAIFATNLGGQYLIDADTYKFFRDREPDTRLGNSVFIYIVKPPAGASD